MVEEINTDFDFKNLKSIKIGICIEEGERSITHNFRILNWFEENLKENFKITDDLKYITYDLKYHKIVLGGLNGSKYQVYLEDFNEIRINAKDEYLPCKCTVKVILENNKIEYIKTFTNNEKLYINFSTGDFGDYFNRYNVFSYHFKFPENKLYWYWYLSLINFPRIENLKIL